MNTRLLRKAICSSGQSILEFAMVMPLVLVLALGVIEFSYSLLHQHVASKLTREGSNLLSRDISPWDAGQTLQSMTSKPLDFANGSQLIFSVLKRVATTGVPNTGKVILYQRAEFGTPVKASLLAHAGGSFGIAPDYIANNSDIDTSLQVTGLPPGLVVLGGMVYVTEIWTRHPAITPLTGLGIKLPDTLYSIAYF